MIDEFTDIIKDEKTILEINQDAVVVVGDLHGNFQDLIRILTKFGLPPKISYLFLGDYVDRGSFSIEVITLLMALKCMFPKNINLLRGNHEIDQINKIYGFYDEIKEMYGDTSLYNRFNESFDYLSIAAILNGSSFCVHGGISPFLHSLEDLSSINKPIDPTNKLIEDLLWSEPCDSIYFTSNSRGKGVKYGSNAISCFLANTNMKYIIRAHECIENGVRIKNNVFTVFSSSDYSSPPNRSGVLIAANNGIGQYVFPDVEKFIKANASYFQVNSENRPSSHSSSIRSLNSSLYKNNISGITLYKLHGGRRIKTSKTPQPNVLKSSLTILPKLNSQIKLNISH